LTALHVKNAPPGRHGDGDGLWLQVRAGGGKSWLFRYQLRGQARQMGLGPVGLVSLAMARQMAHAARLLLLDGVDPIEERARQRQPPPAPPSAPSFRRCAERYIAAHEAGWSNDKHRQQWPATLEAYAHPVLGDLPVDAIDTGLVLRVLEPIWTTKPETASRVRARVESVLSWATVAGFRIGDNPARWRGHLDQLLPARRKVRAVRHHAALPYREMPEFMARLRQQPGTAARCLGFTILTVARTGEAIGAELAEIDREHALWTVPGSRMKGGARHRVPLAPAALTLVPPDGTYLFPGARRGRPLSQMSMLMLLRRMDCEITTHGFRSSFRDWAAEAAHAPREVAEAALAHRLGGVEGAYQRGDMLDRRRELMEAWADFLLPAR